ncbi:MAG: coenzyme F420-0:L-glutamate ligase [Candidatus Daviesbacteria bacterium]|nr:coenzyme F420-0:L-glutamate ligase [Candidatus Daviesbacteria bacterium]
MYNYAVKPQPMQVTAIKTRKFLPPKDNLWELLSAIKNLNENSVVAVTSKVVSICEGRCIPLAKINKDELIAKEADKYLLRNLNDLTMYTIKNNLLVAAAGVDESNGKGYYILWPKNPRLSAKRLWQILRKKFNLKNLGVIITDSRVTPLRRGVVGLAISYFGFKPLKDYRGTKDLFGRQFQMETSDIPDSLATAAVLEMGEGAECQPIAIISDVPYIEFIQKEYIPKNADFSFEIPEKEDLFYPFLSSVKWKKGGSGKNQ